MKLVTKLVTLLVLGICLVLAVDGYLTVRREVDLFEREIRRDAEVTGQMLDVVIGEIWATQGEPRALALIEHANRATAELQLRWVWREPDDPAHAPRSAAALAAALESGAPGSAVQGNVLYTYVPARFDAGRRGALEIGETLEPRDEYTAETTTRISLVVGATIAVCALFAMILGAWVVGRPIERLVAYARAIGDGKLDEKLDLRQRDELGALGAEMTLMSDHLSDARRRLEEETEHRVKAVDELRHAERLSTVGKLSSGLAHELGTPLNVVMQRATMIERGEVEGDETIESARVIREQSDRMTGIVRQLLDFARRQKPRKAPEDLVAIARDTLSLLEPYARRRRVTVALEVDGDDDRIDLDADGEGLQQALTNLVINAVQASDEGATVRVVVGRRDAVPPPGAAAEPGEHCYASVVDTGAGIAEDDLPHLFEPFFTTKGLGDGTGLGLSVAHGIVGGHGGWIEVASDEAETRFTVYLPARGSSAA